MIKARANWLDRAIGLVAPRAALRRSVARGALDITVRGYDGAAVGRRTDGWNTPSTSADEEIGRSLPRLRDRSRDLERNNPHSRKAVSVWKSNLVADGIRPRPRSGSPAIDKRAKELWDAWVKVCDAEGQLDFYGLEELAVGSMVTGGEALIRRSYRTNSDGVVPLRLQVLEGDHLDHYKHGELESGRVAIQGVEFNKRGERVAYWLHPRHPGNGNLALGSVAFGSSVPVSAENVIHLYRKERTQTRGVPWCSAVIRGSRDLDDYETAEIVRKKIEACVVAIVTGAEEGQEAIAGSGSTAQVVDAAGRPVEQFEPGLIAYAHAGKDVKFNNPSASGGYVDYRGAGLHTIAAGYLLPYELLTGDLSKVNFSSARVGLNEFRRLVGSIQELCLVPMFLNRVWDWFCQSAQLAGLLPVASIPVAWDMPEFESVNPIDDANATKIKVRTGEMTLFQAIAKRGYDPVEILEEHAEVGRMLDKLGLVFDSDPRKVSAGGQVHATGGGGFGRDGEPGESRQAEEARRSGHLKPVP